MGFKLFNRFQYPGFSPALDLQHPAARRIRCAAVATAGSASTGAMFDLVTNKVSTWSLGANKATVLGPTVFPRTTSSGGIQFPPIIPAEVLSGGLTMAMIVQYLKTPIGQSPVNLNDGTHPTNSGGTQSLLMTGTPVGTFNMGLSGFNVFLNQPPNVSGHWYFFVVSQFNVAAHPRIVGTLLDMTTGLVTICKEDATKNWQPATVGFNYSIVTYNGGPVDSNPLACASISASPLTQAQQLAWCNDPFGLWYNRKVGRRAVFQGVQKGTTGNSFSFFNTIPPPTAQFSFGAPVFHFPIPDHVGQQVTAPNGVIYQWDGVKWVEVPAAPVVGVSSFNTRTGAVTLTNTDVKTVLPASTNPPQMDGTAAPGSTGLWADGGHIHPTDLTRAAVTAIPAPSFAPAVMDGTASAGSNPTIFARGDHVHPSDTSRLALSGGTMTGLLTLQADPSGTLDAATKHYVDIRAPGGGTAIGQNRIINGAMRVDQRHSGASGNSVNDWPADRWNFSGVTGGDMSYGQNLNSVGGPPGFPYYMGFQTTSVGNVGSVQSYHCFQAIESDFTSDFAWGTASAVPITLSFWVRSSLTGQFSGVIGTRAFVNAGATTYPFIYTISPANTWQKQIITIPVPPSGSWPLSGNLASMVVLFSLGCGSSGLVPASTWVTQAGAGFALAATGSVHLKNTNGATMYITGVKLEVGSTATQMPPESLTDSLMSCQRYYQRLTDTIGGGAISLRGWIGGASSFLGQTLGYSPMRAAPTTAIGGGSFFQFNFNSVSFAASPFGVAITVTPTSTGYTAWYSGASCYLAMDAEI